MRKLILAALVLNASIYKEHAKNIRHQPAPRRTTCASPLKELRAASSFESNQRVRTARSTPEISRAFLRQSFFIFSWKFLRYVSPASKSASGSWITCLHKALPAAVWHADCRRESHSLWIVVWSSWTVSLYNKFGSFSSSHWGSSRKPFSCSDMFLNLQRNSKSNGR